MVVRVEARIGELVGDEHSHPAVIEEASVVAAILDGVVVGIDHVQAQTVLLGTAGHDFDELVRAIAIHVVVDVHPVARLGAIPDHVHLDHGNDVSLLRCAEVRVRVAAVQTLLFAGEVHDANRVVMLDADQHLRQLHQSGSARTIVVSARSDLFGAPRIAGRRVQVTTDDEHLLRRHRAGQFRNQVVELTTAHLVGVARGLDAEAGVILLEVAHRHFEVLEVAVAPSDLRGLACKQEVRVTGDFANMRLQRSRRDHAQQSSDLRVGRRQVRRVDARGRARLGTALFGLVVLAAVVVHLARVNGAERRRAVEVLVREASEDSKRAGSKNQGEEPFDAHVVHGVLLCVVFERKARASEIARS